MAKEEFKKEALQEMRQEVIDAHKDREVAVKKMRQELYEAYEEKDTMEVQYKQQLKEAHAKNEDLASQLDAKARQREHTDLGKMEAKLKGTEEALSRLRFKYAILLHRRDGHPVDGVELHRIPKLGEEIAALKAAINALLVPP